MVMRSLATVLLFVAVTFLCWGVYGPVLHEGQLEMDRSSLRPIICVGIAYFLIAVVVPLIVIRVKGEVGNWTASGAVWSFAAGAAGAVGALGIVLAFKSRGSPLYVMPLVFGLAPVVNTFVTMWMTRTFKQAGLVFFAGMIVVAVGAAGVLIFKPTLSNVIVTEAEDGSITVVETKLVDGARQTKTWQARDESQLENDEKLASANRLYQRWRKLSFGERTMIALSIALTALCWGSYGPVLHKGQMKMGGSRLRPFLCVGLAYFAIAVVVPLVVLNSAGERGQWNLGGTVWSLAAGAAGAIGALGIVMAFNFGGRPIYVMPLVFGGAPVVNTFTTILHEGTFAQVTPRFYVSLLMVILGAVTVLIFAPKPGKKPAPAEPPPQPLIEEAQPSPESSEPPAEKSP